jgi:hypothetical protein
MRMRDKRTNTRELRGERRKVGVEIVKRLHHGCGEVGDHVAPMIGECTDSSREAELDCECRMEVPAIGLFPAAIDGNGATAMAPRQLLFGRRRNGRRRRERPG